MPVKLPFRPRGGEYPPDLWTRCPGCGEMLYNKQLEKNLRVCARCGHHFRLRVDARLAQLLDPDTFEEHDAGLESVDPLGFVDQKPYPERVAAARAATGLRDAAVWGTGQVAGHEMAICVMDFAFMGGSMGSVVGEKVTRAAEHALEARLPLVIVSASGGARMQEGTLALMQLAKTCAALARLAEAGVPFVSVMTDPTTGGVAASDRLRPRHAGCPSQSTVPARTRLMPVKLPFRPRGGEYPPDLWTRCPGCGEMLYNKQLEKNQRVCPRCGHHFRLRIAARLAMLLDPDTWEERDE